MLINNIHKDRIYLIQYLTKSIIQVLVYIVLFEFFFSSCIKKVEDYFGTDYNEATVTPQYSLPLGNFSFDINEELEDLRKLAESYPDSLLYNNDSLPCPLVIDTTIYIPFSFTSVSEEFDNITLLLLRFIFSNGYPTDIEVEATLCDLNGDDIHYIGSYEIQGANCDENNRVIGYQVSDPFDILIPDNIISILDQVFCIKFHYSIETQISSDHLARFYDDYDIKLHVGARIQYEVSIQ